MRFWVAVTATHFFFILVHPSIKTAIQNQEIATQNEFWIAVTALQN